MKKSNIKLLDQELKSLARLCDSAGVDILDCVRYDNKPIRSEQTVEYINTDSLSDYLRTLKFKKLSFARAVVDGVPVFKECKPAGNGFRGGIPGQMGPAGPTPVIDYQFIVNEVNMVGSDPVNATIQEKQFPRTPMSERVYTESTASNIGETFTISMVYHTGENYTKALEALTG